MCLQSQGGAHSVTMRGSCSVGSAHYVGDSVSSSVGDSVGCVWPGYLTRCTLNAADELTTGSCRHQCSGGNVTMSIIEVSKLYKRYRDVVAVRDVSFTVERGEIFGIVGPNGAGKTTTVECIAGLRTPDGGRITVLGRDPQRNRNELHQRV